ncbi:putative sulfate exporter family transporter, partial [Clostridioides difficile]
MIGGTLQSIGQVVASGAIVGENVKDLATIFKIVRVIFLVVVVPEIEKIEKSKELFIDSMKKDQENYDKLVEILFENHYNDLIKN